MAEATTMTARCACGALEVRVSGEPITVQACSCLRCQHRSGSAFAYTAFYPEGSAVITGAVRTWRDRAASGRWTETGFCPICGSQLLSRVEAWTGVLGIAVGCFGDPSFRAPERWCWSVTRPSWLAVPEGTVVMDTQDTHAPPPPGTAP